MNKLVMKNGELQGNPLAGIEHYDLTRLSRLQADQLSGIINKCKGNIRLTSSDVQNLSSIRRTAKAPADAYSHGVNKATADRIASVTAQLKEAFS
jgi:hypothetical protein